MKKTLRYRIFSVVFSLILTFSTWNITTLTAIAEEFPIEEENITLEIIQDEKNGVSEEIIIEENFENVENKIDEETKVIDIIEEPNNTNNNNEIIEETIIEDPIEENTSEVVIENSVEENIIEPIIPTRTIAPKLAKVNSTTDSWTIHVTNILYTAGYQVNGHAVVYNSDQVQNNPSSKNMSAAGVLNWVGGKNRTANGVGYQYTFQNVYILADENGEPAVNLGENLVTITKIQYKGNNELVVTFSDGTQQTIDNNEVYISPVYNATPDWYLNYNYIDNISTGSGSWNNADGIVEYNHIFSNPEDKSPTLTPHYNFEYWENLETQDLYNAGDSFIYTGIGMNNGETKNINIFAMWQPSVTLEYYVENQLFDNVESFDNDILVYNNDYDLTAENSYFVGWYANNEYLDENYAYQLPEITYQNNTATSYRVDAMWQSGLNINYYNNNELVNVINSLEEVSLYDFLVEATIPTTSFYGWFDGEGNCYNPNYNFTLPEISTQKDLTESHDVYAVWQPALIINYFNDKNECITTKISYEDVLVYGYIPNQANFIGWYGSGGNLINIDDIYPLPALTYNSNMFIEYNVYAKFSTPNTPSTKLEDPVVLEDPINSPIEEENLEEDPIEPIISTANPTTNIMENSIPRSTIIKTEEGNWSLVDLICTIITTILGIILLILGIKKNKEEENEEEEKIENIKYHHSRRLISIVPALGLILLLLWTQDFTQPMVLFDKWSLIFIIITLVQGGICIFLVVKRQKKVRIINNGFITTRTRYVTR